MVGHPAAATSVTAAMKAVVLGLMLLVATTCAFPSPSSIVIRQKITPRSLNNPLTFSRVSGGSGSDVNRSSLLFFSSTPSAADLNAKNDETVLNDGAETSETIAGAAEEEAETIAGRKRDRFRNMIPANDELDKTIVKNAIPSMINLAVVPLVNSVDTFWVGRMGIALALAGQAAANQAFFTLFFLVNYLPTITAPLVAAAVGSGDMEQAQKRVGESLFLSNLLGGLGTIFLVAFPTVALSLLLPDGAPALEYARPYLRFRALSMVPALVGATGFAAFRGSLDTVTPLKVSLFTK